MKLMRDLPQTLVYGLLVVVFVYYVNLLPFVMAGYMRNYLVPNWGAFITALPIIVVVTIWSFRRSARAAAIASGAVMLFVVGWQFVINAWPTEDDYRRFGTTFMIVNYANVLLPGVVAPLLALALLIRADTVAPLVIKNWRRQSA